MDLATIQARVDTITGRPDRVDERNSAIQEATMALHGIENWWRDRVEQEVAFAASSNYQQIPILSLPRFRTFSYIRKWDPSGADPLSGVVGAGNATDFFKPLPPDKILDRYGITEDNIYYLTGGGRAENAVAQLRSRVAFQYLLIGWMSFPIVEPLSSYNSWIAALYPNAIITQAAMQLKKYVVDADAVKLLVADAERHLGILLTNGIEYQSR